MRDSALKRLQTFLVESFDELELRRFVRFSLPDGDTIAVRLPQSASLATLAYELIDTLERLGRLNDEFFGALIDERPKYREELLEIYRESRGPRNASPRPLTEPIAAHPIHHVRVHAHVRDQNALNTLVDLWNKGRRNVRIVVADDDAQTSGSPLLRLVLVSRDMLAQPGTQQQVRRWLNEQRVGGPRLIPILLDSAGRHDSPFAGLSPMPWHTLPIYETPRPDDAWHDVLKELDWMLERPNPISPPIALLSPTFEQSHMSKQSPESAPATKLADIFNTTGVPTFSYVEPAQHADIMARFDFMGEGLVVDGPSGIGKTTAVKRALMAYFSSSSLEELKRTKHVTWYEARVPRDLTNLARLVKRKPGSLRGHFVIDDFHRLAPELQRAVADLIKALADSSHRTAKITLIGINPVGESLIRGFPDLSGRFVPVSMRTQPREKILELIQRGEHEANIEFAHRDEFVAMARGSFYTTQLLCAEACVMEGWRERPTDKRTILSRPRGPLLDRVWTRLSFKFHDELIAFASFDAAPPPRGACLALLWLLVESDEGSVQLQAARTRFPQLAAPFDWLMASNFSKLFDTRSRLRDLFFYNRNGAVLSIEDPQLEFYLANITWTAFARDSGHTGVEVSPEVGLTLGARPLTSPPAVARPRPPEVPASWVLHLSDLHFSTEREAVEWSAQLREDLHHELRRTELTAVVLSGDLTNTATPEEFAVAETFLAELRSDFGLSPHQFVIVPGNHDLSWERSKASYQVKRAEELRPRPAPEDCFQNGDYVEVLTDREAYRDRFKAFEVFYYKICGEPYPLEYEQQALIHTFDESRLLFLNLNSAWRIDHHFRSRADINTSALGRALRKIDSEPLCRDFLKIAVWHHPINSPDEDRIKESGFIERLAATGFRFALHGHIHRSEQSQFRYDMAPEGRRIDILGAGTFGAPTRELQPGVPLQYQLLHFEGHKLRVHTRRREKRDGAWRPDARWTRGPSEPPDAFYDLVF